MHSSIKTPKREMKEPDHYVKNKFILNKDSNAENECIINDSRKIVSNKLNECKSKACTEASKSPLQELNKTVKPHYATSRGLLSIDSSGARNSPASRKSVEENGLTSKSSCSNLNSSHPPWVKPLSGLSKTIAKYNSKPSTPGPGTPKGTPRTPRNTFHGPDKGSTATSSINIRKSSSKLRTSVEGKGTPVSSKTPASVGSIIYVGSTPNRKSAGESTQSSDFVASVRRPSSSKKIFATPMCSPANGKVNKGSTRKKSPSNFNQRVSSQGLSAECPSTPSNIYDFECQSDESSSTVSVGVRVRPINSREFQNRNIRNVVTMDGNEVTVKSDNGGLHSFNYDFCFNSCDTYHSNYASQRYVYESMAKPLLFHAYEGYNVCLFAYGQTGSGKSYCIMGENQSSSTRESEILSDSSGIIPRFCQDLFAEADAIHYRNNDKDIQCQVVIEISYIEIYNEKIYDLIGDQNTPLGDEEHRLIGDKREALRVREHPQHGPYVVGASYHLVTSYQDLETWIILGNKQRSIAATAMNDKSSRSHSVFSIQVTQNRTEIIQGEEMKHSLVSIINLVDLAGSERVAASSSEGERLKEGVCINKSLLTLGKVITALADSNGKRKIFIPYRESTLTWLLKESLGGNSKTAMIATISPCNVHQEESLSTLRYAQQARKIVNWNRINEDSSSKLIRALKLEVDRLRALQMASPRVLVEEAEDENQQQPKDPAREPSEEKSDSELQRTRELEIICLQQREINLLKDQMRANQEQYTEKAKIWERQVQEVEARKNALERCRLQGLALKIEDNQPILVNLCEDPQLSQTLLYNLRKGSTTLGPSNADVTLTGLHDTQNHCSIIYEGNKLILHPKRETETFVNGKLLSEPNQIFHNDRIILAGIYFFRVCFPSATTSASDNADGDAFDFFYAKEELLKEQEERIRKEMNLQQAFTQAEMLRELEEQREELRLQEMLMKENVQVLSCELEEERNMNQKNEMAKLMLEEEKEQLEHQVRSLKRLGSQSSDGNSQSSSNEDESFFKKMEMILNESVQIVETTNPTMEKVNVEIYFLIAEANNICTKLKKPYHFQQQSRLNAKGFETSIVVHDLDHNLCAFLDLTHLKRVLDILRDMASNEEEDDYLFESSVRWERADEVSQIPAIQNKIRENARRLSINYALNSSLNGASFSLNNSGTLFGAMSGRKPNSRRSTLSQCSLKGASVSVNQSVLVAKAASQVLLSRAVSTNEHYSIFLDILLKLLEFHNLLKEFIHHFHENSLSSESEEDLNKKIVEITVMTTDLKSQLTRLGAEPIKNLTGRASGLQTNLNSHGITILRKVARMMMGIKEEESLVVDEENIALIKLIHEVTEEVGFLNLVSSFDLSYEASLVSSLTICRSYLIGVSKGLEWSVKMAKEAAESKILVGVMSSKDYSKDSWFKQFIEIVQQVFTSISTFLIQFSKLKVIPSIEPSMDTKDAQKETISFLTRVGSAFANSQELTSALKSIHCGLLNICKDSHQISSVREFVSLLRETLKELVADAGLGRNFGNRKSMRSEANSVVNSDEAFLDNLHTLATKAFKEIDRMKVSVDKFDSEVNPKSDLYSRLEEPLRSSFKSGVRTEEKKVRFTVSLGSTLTDTFIDDGDEDQFDTIDV